jgi:hypothetical protein
MGAYINPTDQTKEAFLAENGKAFALTHTFKAVPEGFLPVVLIDNCAFTGAGIGFCETEWNELRAYDGRPKEGYLVEKQKLYPVSDLKDYERFYSK